MFDRFGLPVSTSARGAVDRLDEALLLIALYRGDPVGALDAALAEDPDFTIAWAIRAAVLAQQTDAAFADEAARSLRAGSACAARASDRERAHLAGAEAFAKGRLHESVGLYARIAMDHPRDLFAVQAAHGGAFFTGRQSDLRDVPLQALRAWSPGEPGRHAILGMAAFGLEECGDYTRALALGQEATDNEPRDAWAVHAVAHVHEMRGDTRAGTAWLEAFPQAWSDSAFSYHNWWHLALLKLDAGDHAGALALYDAKVRPADSNVVLEWIDASAMLWRLRLEGVDFGDRWAPLAARWSRAAEDGVYAFNDLHAVMAFIGAGRELDVARTLKAMRKAAAGVGDNAAMTRDVGLPAAEAFVAFDVGRFAEAHHIIARVRGVAQRFGGSHAQRDVLSLTMLHAALRGGAREAAQALAAERLAHKPESPWARALARRAA
jgi:tetratricopeptide (TPR) repeat protein